MRQIKYCHFIGKNWPRQQVFMAFVNDIVLEIENQTLEVKTDRDRWILFIYETGRIIKTQQIKRVQLLSKQYKGYQSIFMKRKVN